MKDAKEPVRRSNIHVIGVPEEKQRENKAEARKELEIFQNW